MNQVRKPVKQWYFSQEEWNRLGCGPLPPERNRLNQLQNDVVKGSPKIDGKAVKEYN